MPAEYAATKSTRRSCGHEPDTMDLAPVLGETAAGARRTRCATTICRRATISRIAAAKAAVAAGGFPIGGGGGLGIGTIVVLGIIGYALGIDPRLLIGGAEMFSGGGATRAAEPAVGQDRRAERRVGQVRLADPRLRRRAMEADLRAGRTALPRADAGDVHRRDARRRLRRRRSPRWGRSIARPTTRSISTPRSSARSSGASTAATRIELLQVRAGLCDRA